jgi:GxxExxY protein
MPGGFFLVMGDSYAWDRAGGQRDPLTYAIIGCGLKVHSKLGYTLTESAYEEALMFLLQQQGLRILRQAHLSASFEGIELEKAYRPDLVVNGEVVIEIKCVTRLMPVHDAQLLTYLRFSRIERGLILNFHARRFKDGIRRLILTPAPLP